MINQHKKMASRYPNRWKNLLSENNPGLNRLLNGKKTRKNRKNGNRYRKKVGERLGQKLVDEKKSVKDTDDDEKFPPRRRLGPKKEEISD